MVAPEPPVFHAKVMLPVPPDPLAVAVPPDEVQPVPVEEAVTSTCVGSDTITVSKRWHPKAVVSRAKTVSAHIPVSVSPVPNSEEAAVSGKLNHSNGSQVAQLYAAYTSPSQAPKQLTS